MFRTSTSQEEGAERIFSIATTEFVGDEDGNVAAIRCHEVDENFKKIKGSEYEMDADLVLLAMGFTNPVKEGLLEQLGVALDERGNVNAATTNYQTDVPKFLLLVICVAGNRLWYGQSVKDDKPPSPLMNS